MYARGATDDTLLEHLEIFGQYQDGKLPTLGVCTVYNIVDYANINDLQEKPQTDDADVLYCRIPDSRVLAIRIWSDGMEQYGLYCFDFFDVVERTAMNTPNGHAHLGMFAFSKELVSWETAVGLDRIPAGTEKYSTPEGSRLVLSRPGKMPYYFEIPPRLSGHGVVFVSGPLSFACVCFRPSATERGKASILCNWFVSLVLVACRKRCCVNGLNL